MSVCEVGVQGIRMLHGVVSGCLVKSLSGVVGVRDTVMSE